MTTCPAERSLVATTRSVERRELVTRARRDAIARRFSIHPAALGSLDQVTVERMAAVLDGAARSALLGPADQMGHPWAG